MSISARELQKIGRLTKSDSTALDIAKQRNNTDIVQLLRQYQKNPGETQKSKNQLNLKGKSKNKNKKYKK